MGYFIQYLEARDGFPLIKFWLDAESFKSAAGTRDIGECLGRKVLLRGEDSKLCPSRCEHDKISLSTDCDSNLGDSGSVFESPLHSSGSTNDISVRNTYVTNVDENDSAKHNLSISPSPNITLPNSESTRNLPPSPVNRLVCPDLKKDVISSDHSNTYMNHRPSNLNRTKTDSCSSECVLGLESSKRLCVSRSETDVCSGCEVTPSDESERASVASSKDGTTKSYSVASSQLTQATVDDSLRIFNKYISHEASHPIKFPDEARDRVVAAICQDAGMVEADCFTELQDYVFEVMEKE